MYFVEVALCILQRLHCILQRLHCVFCEFSTTVSLLVCKVKESVDLSFVLMRS